MQAGKKRIKNKYHENNTPFSHNGDEARFSAAIANFKAREAQALERERLYAIQELEPSDEYADASKKAGKAVGDSRRRLEKQTGLKVVSSQNYLPPEKK